MSNPIPSNNSEPQTIRLNCFILGDPGVSFHIDIAPTESVDSLKSAIKDEYEDEFARMSAAAITLWNVDLPLNEESKHALKSFKINRSKIPFLMEMLEDIFGSAPANDRLHVVVMPAIIRLNCFILGDHGVSFHIDIPPTDSIYFLKEAVKDKYKDEFSSIHATRITVCNVDLPLNEESKHALKSFKIDNSKLPFPTKLLEDIFGGAPANDRLHIVVLPELRLNCLISGHDPGNIFSIQFCPGETMLMAIKSKMRGTFPYIDNSAVLWKANLPINDELKHVKLDLLESLSPTSDLVTYFPNVPDKNLLHIIVQNPSYDEMKRRWYIGNRTGAPSADGRPSAFAGIQENREYLCNRPRSAADAVPVILFEPIFAEFVDNCQNHQPTLDENNFVHRLSQNIIYTNGTQISEVFKKLLYDIDIYLQNVGVGNMPWMDGCLLSPCKNFPLVIVTVKSEIASNDNGAEPFAESLVSYRKFMEKWEEKLKLSFLFPCIHIIVFGACIGISGSVFTHKVQSDVLVPIIPLFWHSTDSPMQAMAARTFGALGIAIKKLEELYKQPMPQLEPDAYTSLLCPYPRAFTEELTKRIQKFSYDVTQNLRHKLIFFGTVKDTGKKICIKFVRNYSPEAHRFCAEKGHAPELIAYKPLAGGWNMVVMDDIKISYNRLHYRELSLMTVQERQPLNQPITSLIEALHNHCGTGYVHGDLHDTNFLVRGDMGNFMLIDFDWAGPVGQTFYPMFVNRRAIERPDDAQDGMMIKPEHDMEMLEYLFDAERPAKRLRTI